MAKISSALSEKPRAPEHPDHSSEHSAEITGLKFEAALAELEQLVRNMEDGRLPLEESIAAYRRGSELLGHCQHLLQDAETKIQMLENGVLRDFDAAFGDER